MAKVLEMDLMTSWKALRYHSRQTRMVMPKRTCIYASFVGIDYIPVASHHTLRG